MKPAFSLTRRDLTAGYEQIEKLFADLPWYELFCRRPTLYRLLVTGALAALGVLETSLSVIASANDIGWWTFGWVVLLYMVVNVIVFNAAYEIIAKKQQVKATAEMDMTTRKAIAKQILGRVVDVSIEQYLDKNAIKRGLNAGIDYNDLISPIPKAWNELVQTIENEAFSLVSQDNDKALQGFRNLFTRDSNVIDMKLFDLQVMINNFPTDVDHSIRRREDDCVAASLREELGRS